MWHFHRISCNSTATLSFIALCAAFACAILSDLLSGGSFATALLTLPLLMVHFLKSYRHHHCSWIQVCFLYFFIHISFSQQTSLIGSFLIRSSQGTSYKKTYPWRIKCGSSLFNLVCFAVLGPCTFCHFLGIMLYYLWRMDVLRNDIMSWKLL